MDSPSLVLVETVRPNASMSPLAESIEKPRARPGAESCVRKCVRVYVCVCERALVCEGACVCVWVYCVRACVYTVGGVVCLWVGGLVGVACDTFAGPKTPKPRDQNLIGIILILPDYLSRKVFDLYNFKEKRKQMFRSAFVSLIALASLQL